MSAIIADTHVVIWYLTSPEKLSAPALAALDEADTTGGPIYLASVSLVEIAYLIEKRRLPEAIFERLSDELARPDSTLTIVPLDLALAATLRRVPYSEIADMPDRIIAATALHLGLPLVTKDKQIRSATITTIW